MDQASGREQDRHAPPARARGLGGLPFGRVAGIQLVADWSLIIIFALVLVNLGVAVFPFWHPEWSAGLVWGVAFGAAVLFFVSVLLHELSHALVGRLFGIPVRRITLFVFGGMAHMEREPPSPASEFWMAVAGPIASLLIGVVSLVGAGALSSPLLALSGNPMQLLTSLGPVATLLFWLGPVNILLGVFNLVPGFPLDGGRVLRAILWAATKDLEKATRWASWGGQAVGWLLIALGVLSFFSGGLGQGLWLALIGWFLLSAAKASYEQTVIHEALRDTRVADVMRRGVDTLPPNLPVSVFVSEYILRTDQESFPVVVEGHLLGTVGGQDVRRVPRDAWETTPISEIMTPARNLETIEFDAPAVDALRKLGERDTDAVPVVERDGSLLGLVRRRDIMRWLNLHRPARA